MGLEPHSIEAVWAPFTYLRGGGTSTPKSPDTYLSCPQLLDISALTKEWNVLCEN